MNDQKNSNLNLVSSAALAVMGAFTFVAIYGYARYGSDLLGDSMIVVWFVFLALIIEFFTAPLFAYWRTASVKTAITVFILQVFFIAIFLVTLISSLWWYFIE